LQHVFCLSIWAALVANFLDKPFCVDLTATTESSSDMSDCDVVVLCRSKQLKKKVEKILHEKEYSAAICLIFGREKISNLKSAIHHGRKK